MAWISENRRNAILEKPTGGYLTDNLKAHLREKYLPRYPTKRAVLLPALHLVQHTYNWIPVEAVQEIAEFLEIAPAEAMDTATFYEEFWLKPKGKFLVGICRSLACELCGEKQMLDHLRAKLGIARVCDGAWFWLGRGVTPTRASCFVPCSKTMPPTVPRAAMPSWWKPINWRRESNVPKRYACWRAASPCWKTIRPCVWPGLV